jgi:hypothetical protein
MWSCKPNMSNPPSTGNSNQCVYKNGAQDFFENSMLLGIGKYATRSFLASLYNCG